MTSFDIRGIQSDLPVINIAGYSLSSDAPVANQVMKFDDTLNQWVYSDEGEVEQLKVGPGPVLTSIDAGREVVASASYLPNNTSLTPIPVTFSTTMPSIPIVNATLEFTASQSDAKGGMHVNIQDVTTAGFTALVTNVGNIAFTGGLDINWIAISTV